MNKRWKVFLISLYSGKPMIRCAITKKRHSCNFLHCPYPIWRLSELVRPMLLIKWLMSLVLSDVKSRPDKCGREWSKWEVMSVQGRFLNQVKSDPNKQIKSVATFWPSDCDHWWLLQRSVQTAWVLTRSKWGGKGGGSNSNAIFQLNS